MGCRQCRRIDAGRAGPGRGRVTLLHLLPAGAGTGTAREWGHVWTRGVPARSGHGIRARPGWGMHCGRARREARVRRLVVQSRVRGVGSGRRGKRRRGRRGPGSFGSGPEGRAGGARHRPRARPVRRGCRQAPYKGGDGAPVRTSVGSASVTAVRSGWARTAPHAEAGSGRRRGRWPVPVARTCRGSVHRRGCAAGQRGCGAAQPPSCGGEIGFRRVRPNGSHGVFRRPDTGYRRRPSRPISFFQPSGRLLSAIRFPPAGEGNSSRGGGFRTEMAIRKTGAAGTGGPEGSGSRVPDSLQTRTRRHGGPVSAEAISFALPRHLLAEAPSGHRVHTPRP